VVTNDLPRGATLPHFLSSERVKNSKPNNFIFSFILFTNIKPLFFVYIYIFYREGMVLIFNSTVSR